LRPPKRLWYVYEIWNRTFMEQVMTDAKRSLFFADATEVLQMIRKGDLSPAELMRLTLERIDAVNPKLNAFVCMRPAEQLLAEAKQAGERLARGGDIGPLAGMPLGVKDLEDTIGLPNTHGSLLFKEAQPSTFDTVQVERLKRAGAIVIGKTNTPESGYTAFTSNRVFGTTRNPWNLERTPGGSSGGSSAAVAGGLVALATASDGGGSVRIPACYTGLFGLKPSQGRIPWGPEEMLRASFCIVSGPLTRSVRDAALWLDLTVGAHPADPYSLPHPALSYREALQKDPPRLRIGYTSTLGYARCEGQVIREVEAALKALEGAGHTVEPADLQLSDIVIDWVRLMASEDIGFMAPHLNDLDLLDPGYRPGLDLGSQVTAKDMGDIQRTRAALIARLADFFSRFDLLATPTVPTVAFPAEGPLPFYVEDKPIETPGGGIAFTYPFNFSANPAVSLRAGLSDDRLPVGLQLVAPRLREDLLLQVSRQYEELRPWKGEWPDL
jgi:aspartyl-tRNA(Asn)/glutamyl-tRNA(Gln) amidotransferase subunit A